MPNSPWNMTGCGCLKCLYPVKDIFAYQKHSTEKSSSHGTSTVRTMLGLPSKRFQMQRSGFRSRCESMVNYGFWISFYFELQAKLTCTILKAKRTLLQKGILMLFKKSFIMCLGRKRWQMTFVIGYYPSTRHFNMWYISTKRELSRILTNGAL